MKKVASVLRLFAFVIAVGSRTSELHAQEMPAEYQQVLKTVGKSGDYKANVLKVNIPRNDIHVTIRQSRSAYSQRLWRMVRHDQGR